MSILNTYKRYTAVDRVEGRGWWCIYINIYIHVYDIYLHIYMYIICACSCYIIVDGVPGRRCKGTCGGVEYIYMYIYMYMIYTYMYTCI